MSFVELAGYYPDVAWEQASTTIALKSSSVRTADNRQNLATMPSDTS
jgi:hypothetical protein